MIKKDGCNYREVAVAAAPSFLKTLSASFTLGTGNSLGPEGPSVEIGASIARGIASLPVFNNHNSNQTKLSLLAAGSAAGLSIQCCCCWLFFCCGVGVVAISE
uniref:Uncharacterized protein n=1 Tax=Salix viminalis TaxID=40686 RepID=A0A6N2LNM5_SALVM